MTIISCLDKGYIVRLNRKNEQTMITFVVVGLLCIENIFVAGSTMIHTYTLTIIKLHYKNTHKEYAFTMQLTPFRRNKT